MNPGSQYPGYVDYLHSVSGNNAQGNFPYESFPYSLNLGASQIPHFSSQQTEAPSQPDNPPVETPVERMVRKKWNLVDDEVLISAWLITSKDAVVGTEQKLRNFWKRVGHYFSAAHHEKRDGEHCKQRWHKINGDTNKYCAAYAAAERLQSSGQNDNDLVKKAHEIYFADHGSKFTLDHAWCLLRYEQKWLSLNTPKSGGEKRKTGEVGSQASSSNVGEEEPRPEEDCTGRTSLTPLQKCTATIRQLAYGAAADSVDEYIRLGESTARKCLHKFAAGIITLFGDEYLRTSNARGSAKTTTYRRTTWISGDVWEHRLYVLGVEELPHSLERNVLTRNRKTDNCVGGGSFV
uniref:Myb-like domain-containing protein n=1 Tax=Brassica oleracea var. oleracea TaxID=109376 RepID=A0A0D3DME8_BRAOL